jgi:hypothetical protein
MSVSRRADSGSLEVCSSSDCVRTDDRRRSHDTVRSLQFLPQSRDAVAQFLQRRSLIASARLQFLDVSHDRSKQRYL